MGGVASLVRVVSGDGGFLQQLHHRCVVDLTKRCARAKWNARGQSQCVTLAWRGVSAWRDQR
jgi:hypothetical protein